MFKMNLLDSLGNKLAIGDIVKVFNYSTHSAFYAEVKYLADEQVITPFHTFSFHRFEKVDKVPENAIKCNEERYNIWYLDTKENEVDIEYGNQYLSSWRQCEHLIDRCFSIELLTN